MENFNYDTVEVLQEGRLLDNVFLFLLVKRFITPIKKWKAYTMGLIDEDGITIKKPKTTEEKNALTLLDRVILKIKHLVGNHKLKLLTTYFFLKEDVPILNTDEEIEEEIILDEKTKLIKDKIKELIESENIDEETFWNRLFLLEARDENNWSRP